MTRQQHQIDCAERLIRLAGWDGGYHRRTAAEFADVSSRHTSSYGESAALRGRAPRYLPCPASQVGDHLNLLQRYRKTDGTEFILVAVAR